MTDLSDLLAQLPVPDHGPEFWSDLDAHLADTAPLHSVDTLEPDAGGTMVDLDLRSGGDDASGLVNPPRRIRRWVLASAAAVAVAVALLVGLDVLDGDDLGPVETVDTTTTTITTTTLPPPSSSAPPGPTTSLDASIDESSAPLLSNGVPLTLSRATDLRDGDTITVSGTGFDTFDQLGVAQCYAPIGQSNEPDVDLCDLSNYVIPVADDDGSFQTTFSLRRYIANKDGDIDCADPEPPYVCAIGASDINDPAQFGITEITFDTELDGPPAPALTLTPSEGLRHGQTVTVIGKNFEPGETAFVTTCTLTSPGFESCRGQNGLYAIVVDEDGTFEREIEVRRFDVSGVDCSENPYGCRLTAKATRDAHPLLFTFDTSEPPPNEPGLLAQLSGLLDNQKVRVELPRLGVAEGTTFEAKQCLSRDFGQIGPLCNPAVTGTVTSTGIVFDYTVTSVIDTDSTSYPGCVAYPGFSLCSMLIETDDFIYPALPVTFDESVPSEQAPPMP